MNDEAFVEHPRMLNPLARPPQRLWLLAAGAILLALASCKPAQPEPAPLMVGLDQWAGYYPIVLAEELGYLREAGVRVDIQFPQDTHRMIADFAGGSFDIVGVSLADIVVTTRVRPDICMMLCSDESTGGDQLFGRGPLADNEQIRGKRIGTTVGGFGEIFVRRFLELRGLTPREVVLVNTEAAEVPGLLERGEIDIGHTWEPYAQEARSKGFRSWFTSAQTPGLIFDGLMTRKRLIETRRADLQALVDAWFRALDWWRVHPEEGNRMIETRLGLPAGSAAPNGMRLLDRNANRDAFSQPAHGTGLLAACGTDVEFFVSRGMLGTRPRPEDLLFAGFVE
jgi:NitT/TauT family transport system substrate-binding protein